MNGSTSPDSERDAASGSGDEHTDAGLLRDYDILRLRAPNPGPLTLTGTNTWVVGRRPAWVVDPGPLIDKHMQRLLAAIDARGGLGGVALTHGHADHEESVEMLLEVHPAPLAAARPAADFELDDELRFGPFQAVATPGHAEDHYALIADGACFTGDAVLGNGSVLLTPHRGALAGYLLALTRLRLREDFNVLCPGHGEIVWDAREKLEEYIAHRIDRENRLIVALNEGLRSISDLLDAVWGDVPEELRPAATATLAAHLDKLEDDEVLPRGVERPSFEGRPW
ncbi:MAG: beta-lactamase domain protein [Solirubrobacterales bacterium]|jgi:glyoxylase-like metal-dependent hydrolase (beta-lactamase superfamily II)|nr:beta-lactamase domain protein [Solirubrobacterales bacterium]